VEAGVPSAHSTASHCGSSANRTRDATSASWRHSATCEGPPQAHTQTSRLSPARGIPRFLRGQARPDQPLQAHPKRPHLVVSRPPLQQAVAGEHQAALRHAAPAAPVRRRPGRREVACAGHRQAASTGTVGCGGRAAGVSHTQLWPCPCPRPPSQIPPSQILFPPRTRFPSGLPTFHLSSITHLHPHL
jgi:hypothetical protein